MPLYIDKPPAIIMPAKPAQRQGLFQPGFLGTRPARVEFAASASNTTNPLNNFSATGQSFGSEDASRQIVVLVWAENANLSTVGDVTSVTVGGVGASKLLAVPSSFLNLTLWLTTRTDQGGPSGASGTYTISRSIGNGFTFVVFGAYALYNLHQNADSFDDVASLSATSVALDLAGGGVLVTLATQIAADYTWTGATEAFDALGSGVTSTRRRSGALLNNTGGESNHSVGVNTASAMLAASFR